MYDYDDLDSFVEKKLREFLEPYFTVKERKRKNGSDKSYFGLYPKDYSLFPDVDRSTQMVFLGRIAYTSTNSMIYVNYEGYDGRFFRGPSFDRSFMTKFDCELKIERFCNYIVSNLFINVVDKDC